MLVYLIYFALFILPPLPLIVYKYKFFQTVLKYTSHILNNSNGVPFQTVIMLLDFDDDGIKCDRALAFMNMALIPSFIMMHNKLFVGTYTFTQNIYWHVMGFIDL